MLTEDYVTFETAKLLKEKGFDGICDTAYETITSKHSVEEAAFSDWGKLNQIKRPTLQMAMKWLREVYKKWITITFHWYTIDGEAILYYSPYIMLSKYENIVLEDKNPFKMKLFNSYEQACEAAIKYCLENLI